MGFGRWCKCGAFAEVKAVSDVFICELCGRAMSKDWLDAPLCSHMGHGRAHSGKVYYPRPDEYEWWDYVMYKIDHDDC